MPTMVIGSGPGALRAAASTSGILLDTDTAPGGWKYPDVPEDRGVVEERPGVAERVAELYGAAPSVERQTAVWWRGGVRKLPLPRRLVLPSLGPSALGQLFRARAEARSREFVGGGAEERTYAAWALHHFGAGVAEALYRSYAHRRWGDPSQLNVSAARLAHWVPPAPLLGLGSDPASGFETLLSKIKERRGGVRVQRIEVRDGRVSRVVTDQGAEGVDGLLYLAAAPRQVEAWLAEHIEESVRWDLRRLGSRHRVQVAFASQDDLPDEIHVLDEGCAAFRLDRFPGGRIAQLSLDEGDPLWRSPDADIGAAVSGGMAAVGLARPEGAFRVIRIADHDPAWVGPWHPAITRAAAALDALGIRLVGRAGTHRHVDPGQELLYDAAIAEPGSFHEAARVILDPPVKSEEAEPPLRNFIAR